MSSPTVVGTSFSLAASWASHAQSKQQFDFRRRSKTDQWPRGDLEHHPFPTRYAVRGLADRVAAQLLGIGPPAPFRHGDLHLRGGARATVFASTGAISEGANAAKEVLGFWSHITRAFAAFWTHSSGTFLIAAPLVALICLRKGVIERVHGFIVRWMALLLREERMASRPYRQCFISAVEKPLQALCIVISVCQFATIASGLISSTAFTKFLQCYRGVVLGLAWKICLGAFLLGVVNLTIQRFSRGLAKKSDIIGAETSRQEAQVLALGQTARVIVCVATFIACLPAFHVDFGTLLSFCGVGGLALSLLSKGVLVNLIGSLTIYLTQPFTLGDWIHTVDSDEVNGWVQSMGLYHTVVMRWDRRPLYIPNSALTSKQIINASRMSNRRIMIDIPVRFLDLDKISELLEDITDFINGHREIDPEMHRHVRLRRIDAYAVIIWVSCYTKSINLQDYVEVKEDVILNIKNIFFKHGTTFASSLERQPIGSSSQAADDYAAMEGMGAAVGLASGGAADPASMGGFAPAQVLDDDVLRKPQPLVASRKPVLALDLEGLKQQQENIWERERDLKENARILERKAELLGERRAQLAQEQGTLEKQDTLLYASLDGVAFREDFLSAHEIELDSQNDQFLKREDFLDDLYRDMRMKSGFAQDVSTTRELDDDAQRVELEEADRINELQRELSLQKKKIEQEREMLKAQQQEQELQESDSEDATSDGPAEQEEVGDEGSDAAVDEEAVRLQKIAEQAVALGGE